MKRQILLTLTILSGVISFQAYGTERNYDYIRELPTNSKIRQECEACKGSGILGFFKSAKEKACQDLNQVFQNEEKGVKYEAPLLDSIIRGFYSKWNLFGDYHLEYQQKLIKAAIRTILSKETDEQKKGELAHCWTLIKEIPQMEKDRKEQEKKERVERLRKERERF